MIRRSNQAISALAHSSDRRVAEMSDSKLPADELADWQAEDGDWLETVTGDVTAPAPVVWRREEQTHGEMLPFQSTSRLEHRRCYWPNQIKHVSDDDTSF